MCHRARVPFITADVLRVLIYLAAAFTLASGVHYVFLLRQRLGRPEAENPSEAQP
jgi:hypothetical protein